MMQLLRVGRQARVAVVRQAAAADAAAGVAAAVATVPALPSQVRQEEHGGMPSRSSDIYAVHVLVRMKASHYLSYVLFLIVRRRLLGDYWMMRVKVHAARPYYPSMTFHDLP